MEDKTNAITWRKFIRIQSNITIQYNIIQYNTVKSKDTQETKI
jgi:uncharacterized protein with HEPN domain